MGGDRHGNRGARFAPKYTLKMPGICRHHTLVINVSFQ